ncbi:MAG: DUF456 family protein [Phycisphaeraceae bacterium]|nr:DUF456 family protein [Phycisphaeraceae bacterium]
MTLLAGLILLIVAVIGFVLTIATLPGTWFILGMAVLVHWLWGEPPVLNMWNLGACFAAALLAEVAELALSAVGAAKYGGGKSGAIGSIIGGVVGAIAGTLVVPILGTIVGGVIGAGVGAVVLEKGVAQRSWGQAARIGQGAAVGRAVSVVMKAAVAAAIGVSLTIDALIR